MSIVSDICSLLLSILYRSNFQEIHWGSLSNVPRSTALQYTIIILISKNVLHICLGMFYLQSFICFWCLQNLPLQIKAYFEYCDVFTLFQVIFTMSVIILRVKPSQTKWSVQLMVLNDKSVVSFTKDCLPTWSSVLETDYNCTKLWKLISSGQ